MLVILEGVLAGYGIAIPVGAIAVLILDVSLRRGFRVGFMAGAGAAFADFLYAALAVGCRGRSGPNHLPIRSTGSSHQRRGAFSGGLVWADAVD